MHKLTFWKKIGLSFIVLVAILILINHQLNKDTNTPNRLTLSNLFTVDVKKSHVPWITTADNNKQKALDVVNHKMASTIKNFISKEEKSRSYYSINHEIVYNTDQLFTLKLELNRARADSYTKNVYYTINKSTGKSIPLSAYFKNSDYKEVISKEILKQMKAEMKKDTNKVYWCQKNDNPRLKVFRKIKATILINKVNLLSALINLKWLPVIWETLHSQLKMTYSTTTSNSRLLSCENKIVFSLIEISSK